MQSLRRFLRFYAGGEVFCVLVSKVGAPHHFVVQSLEECLSFYLYYFYSVRSFAQCQRGAIVSLFVTAVNGDKVVVAAA